MKQLTWKIDRNGNKARTGKVGAERTRATAFEQELWARMVELEDHIAKANDTWSRQREKFQAAYDRLNDIDGMYAWDLEGDEK